MKKAILAATCVCLAIFSVNGNAAIISTDWQSAGDNLITRDTTNSMEWLDLTVTRNMSYNEVIAEMNAGGMLYGWRYATFAEISGFFDEFGGVSTYYTGVFLPQNYDVVNAILPYWGELYCTSPGYTCMPDEQGATFMQNYDGFNYSNVYRGMIYVNPTFYGALGQIDIADIPIGTGTDFTSDSIGSALVRGIAPVPVPTAIWLFGSGFLGLIRVARRKNKHVGLLQ